MAKNTRVHPGLKIIVVVLLIIPVLAGVVFYFINNGKVGTGDKKETKIEEKAILSPEEQLERKSLEEKIGQLLIVGFEGKIVTPEVEELFETIHPGGVILFSRNIENVEQFKKLTADLQNLSEEKNNLPLFIAIDQEGGAVRRINWLNDQIAQSEIVDETQAYEVGFSRGQALKDLGINLNLAPVLEVAKEEDFICERTFKKDSKVTGELAAKLINGQKQAGIFTSVKHFPGYVDIDFDPENDRLPKVKKTPEHGQFKKTKEAQPEMVMTANVIYEDIDPENPFTFSKKGIEMLRENLGGDFLVISDDLTSKVLTESYPPAKPVVLAKKAGVDLLLMGWEESETLIESFLELKKSVESGEISLEETDETVLKILKLKENPLSMDGL